MNVDDTNETIAHPMRTERDHCLSSAVDCLNRALELGDDTRLQRARALVLAVAFAEPEREAA